MDTLGGVLHFSMSPEGFFKARGGVQATYVDNLNDV